MNTSDFEPSYFDVDCDSGIVVGRFSVKRLTDEDNVEQLGHELTGLIEKLQHRQIVLDVSTIDYVTSAVIGKFIMMHRRLDREGGKLVLCGIRPPLADILGAAKLLNYFTVRDDVDSARMLFAEKH